MHLTPSIFKAYDIRGTTPATLNDGVAEALGLAFGTQAIAQGERVVAVGRDGRLSGPALSQALMRGLVAAGVEVIDIGLATTPMPQSMTIFIGRASRMSPAMRAR